MSRPTGTIPTRTTRAASSPANCAAQRALIALGCLALSGCATTTVATFPATGPTRVWPAPPDPPRIRYLGQLTGEASIGVRTSGWDAVKQVLTGPRPLLHFVAPCAVAARGQRIYVADRGALGGPCVYALDLAAHSVTAFRGAADEPLEWPIDIALIDDRLAVADARRAAVYVFDANGTRVTTIGRGALQRPSAVAWDAAQRELWVVDAAAHACVAFGLDGAVRCRVGQRGSGSGQFNFPTGLCVLRDPPRIVVADAMNFRVQLFSSDGAPLGAFGRKGDAAGCFALPRDVAADSEGHLYVLDPQFENVQIFDDAGRLLLAFGEEGDQAGQFNLPGGIAIDEQDRIWVADTQNKRVQAFQYLRAAPAVAAGAP